MQHDISLNTSLRLFNRNFKAPFGLILDCAFKYSFFYQKVMFENIGGKVQGIFQKSKACVWHDQTMAYFNKFKAIRR